MKQAVPWWFFFPDVTFHYLMWLLRIAAVPWGWCDFSRLMWLKYGACSTFATISSIGRIEDLSLSLRMALQSKFHKEIQTFDIYLLWQTILCLRWQDGRFPQALFHIWWSTCTTLVGNELAWFKHHIFKLYTLLHFYHNSCMVIICYHSLYHTISSQTILIYFCCLECNLRSHQKKWVARLARLMFLFLSLSWPCSGTDWCWCTLRGPFL